MIEFKGTKGEWSINVNDTGHITSVRSIEADRIIFTSKVNNMIESNANMNLAMNALEMFEMLKYIYNAIENENIIIKDNEDNNNIESFGYYLYKNIKQLLTKITE